jgi:hypothetical protein
MPWRVIYINRSKKRQESNFDWPNQGGDISNQITGISAHSQSIPSVSKSRKRPGKKRRIVLRKRVAAAEDARMTDAEKRNKENRENKIKRRQKKREQKAGLSVTGVAGDDHVGILN